MVMVIKFVLTLGYPFVLTLGNSYMWRSGGGRWVVTAKKGEGVHEGRVRLLVLCVV